MTEVQLTPVADSPNNDAFEAVVETYFQTQGYITSAGKWFWVREPTKQQRGYQDIDVLAVNGVDTIIISATSNLDDKLNCKDGTPSNEKLIKLKNHFERIRFYLSRVDQYKWMVSKPRKVRFFVAYNHAFKKTLTPIKKCLHDAQIEIVSAKEILEFLNDYTRKPNLKIQNPLLRTIQLLGKN